MTIFHNPKQDQSIQRGSEKSSEIGSEKSSEKILAIIRENPAISAKELAGMIGISSRAIEKHLSGLKHKGLLKRIGSDKGGHWELST